MFGAFPAAIQSDWETVPIEWLLADPDIVEHAEQIIRRPDRSGIDQKGLDSIDKAIFVLPSSQLRIVTATLFVEREVGY